MKNIYNKGRYRNGEYAKHLRPFLKTNGNRKFRRTAKNEIENANSEMLEIEFQESKRIARKLKKEITVKAKKYSFNKNLVRTYIKKYRTMRGALDSLKQNNIIEGKIISRK
jgi:hypothetical protein